MSRRVLLIGWDAADWRIITPLMEAGKMPHLECLINRGVMGSLASLYPTLSPMLWTSIATGKRPFKHGICGFTEPDPDSGGVRPVTNLSRKTRAIWNILNLKKRTCNVVGWWPSHPAEPISGVMVSDHYHKLAGPVDKPWPVRPGTIHPERLVEQLAKVRVHPQELTADVIGPFVPDFAKVDRKKDVRLRMLAKIIAECTTMHAAATALIQLEPWDLMAVYYDSLDHFCHGFMRYHPPQMEGTSQADFEMYKGVVEGGYRLHDAMLGVLVGLAGEDVTVILVSDHGFHPDHLRPKGVPRIPAGPAVQHRQQGIFVMAGAGIKKDERIYGASLLDVVPTILTLYGLPVGKDMDGKPLLNAFDRPPKVRTIQSWDHVPGPDGTHPPDVAIDPVEARETIQRLAALGYVDKPDENLQKAVADTVRELRYNTALAYMDANRHAEAAGSLEELAEQSPDEYRFSMQLVTCYQALGRAARARRILDAMIDRKIRNIGIATEGLREWHQDHQGANFKDVSPQDRRELYQLQGEASRSPYSLEHARGVQFLIEGDAEAALVYFQNAELINPQAVGIHLRKGQAFLLLKQWEHAEESFREALGIEPESPTAQIGLCWSLIRRRQNRMAADTALNAIGLLFYNPTAHYLLGVALHRMGRIERALEALRVCVAQNPNYAPAHERLADIYERRIGNPTAAEDHRRLAAEAKRQIYDLQADKIDLGPVRAGRTPVASDQDVFESAVEMSSASAVSPDDAITVVSGLPRSGKSMMMQMLSAGGLSLLVDEKRPSDTDNVSGKYDYSPVKSLAKDTSWLPRACGKAVKVVAQLLAAMPRGKQYHYRLILMERDLRELVALQQDDTVFARGKNKARLSPKARQEVLARQIRRIRKLLAIGRFSVLYVSFRNCIDDAPGVARRINTFLGGSLDEQAMAAAVDPKLHRHQLGDIDAAHHEA